MKILTFTNCRLDEKLGSGKTVSMYSKGLKKLGHYVSVNEPRDYEVFPNLNRAVKFRQAWGAWLVAQEKLRHSNYDILECYGDEFWLVIQQISKLKLDNRPMIVAHTNGLELLDRDRSYAYDSKSAFRVWFDRQTHARLSNIAFAKTDAFVSLCQLDCQYVLDRGLYTQHRAAVVPPGLDSEYLSMDFCPKRENRVAFTGSWIPRKGIKNLCLVMTKVLSQKLDLYFDIYGTRDDPDVILSCFPDVLQERIIVHPRLSNQEIAEGLAKAKVFFFPTQYEGYGIALAEAMACGCAVVTTPTGLGYEIEHGTEGLVCDFNDVDKMEKSINKLLEFDDLRISISQAGFDKVSGLTWEANVKKLEEKYQEWILDYGKSSIV